MDELNTDLPEGVWRIKEEQVGGKLVGYNVLYDSEKITPEELEHCKDVIREKFSRFPDYSVGPVLEYGHLGNDWRLGYEELWAPQKTHDFNRVYDKLFRKFEVINREYDAAQEAKHRRSVFYTSSWICDGDVENGDLVVEVDNTFDRAGCDGPRPPRPELGMKKLEEYLQTYIYPAIEEEGYNYELKDVVLDPKRGDWYLTAKLHIYIN